ncbi:radical SAM protein [Candidatus Omnitrophota bacterium]
MQKTDVKEKDDLGLTTLSKKSIKDDTSVYLFGDSHELHDRIVGKSGDFQRSITRIRGIKRGDFKIKIGISKFNFFRLGEIAQFSSSLMGRRLDLRSVSMNFFPVKRLYSHFNEYVKELNMRIGPKQIQFFLTDERVPDLLRAVSLQADQYNEKDLLRLLGVLAEHPFIGPQTIVLDTFHRCNTNCVHCWIHSPKRKLDPALRNLKMELPLYKKIVDDAAELLCDEIIIQGDGEPLLDSRFMDIIRYARAKGLKVIFFTNGILLDEKKAKKIIDLEINEIFCSLPAGSDTTYARINSMQSKETFHKIVTNLKNFISLRSRLKKERPLLQISHVIHNFNFHELEAMAKIDAQIGADKARFYLARLDKNIKSLKIKPAHVRAMRKSLIKVEPYLRKKHIELQDNIYFQLKNYNSATGYWSENKFLRSGCPVGWFFSLILAEGEVSMCCHLRVVDYLRGGRYFKEVWNSESYNRFRIQAKFLMKNKKVTFPNGVKLYDEFCSHCDTHQVILRIHQLLRKYGLKQFL